MKILTWNINGIRASKRCLKDVFDSLDADVICLQETKITRDMLDEPSAIVEGYNSYFSFSRKRSGYSGTANFCRDGVTPVAAEEGLSGKLTSQSEGSIGCVGKVEEYEAEELVSLDSEGRAVITQHQIELKEGDVRDLAIINVYVPRVAEKEGRWTYKFHFLALLQSRAECLLRNGSHVIVLGDINTTHKHLDHCDPSSQEFRGFESRQWIDQLLRPEDRDPDLAPIEDRAAFEATMLDAEGSHFIDAFRYFYPDKAEAYTNWSTVTSARQTNYGKRLDYIFIDKGLEDCLVDCHILSDFEGSDHCPMVLELRCNPVPAKKCPPFCTKWMPEFQGKQQKLLSFFSKSAGGKSVINGNKEGEKVKRNDELERETGEDAQLFEAVEVVSSQSSASSSSPLLPSLSDSFQAQRKKDTQGEKSPLKGGLKRTLSDKVSDVNAKKKKGGKGDNSSASNMGGKQASLLNFFRKPPSSSSVQETDSKETSSKYWQKDGNDGTKSSSEAKASPSKDSKAKKEKSTSSSKLSLPSLSLIPCKNKTDSHSIDSDVTQAVDEAENSTLQKIKLPGTKLNAEQPENTTDPPKPKASSVWKGLLSGPPPPPPCKGHKEPCVLRTVKKPGPNKGKQFYVCARPEGHSSNKEARCEHFQWISYMSAGKKS
ncbi:DNA-(apurinic or apyrimidinic site) endonuclease 2-like [Littorina saxatilis]|uniref:DNA-(apurinic or apyrimidinic site) endonuclease n=1 Tax=Littorina saxatilis TaxID=31220 RepID=A0AAN9BA80_9CAEN